MHKRRKTLFQQQQTLLPSYLAPLRSSNNRIQRMRLTLLHLNTIMEPFSQVDTHTDHSQLRTLNLLNNSITCRPAFTQTRATPRQILTNLTTSEITTLRL